MSKPVRNVIADFLQAAIRGELPVDPMNPDGEKLPLVSNPDILSLYNLNMEVQVNVSSVGAETVEGKRNTWTKNGNEFWHLRCPKNAMHSPQWEDYNLDWSLSHHAEAVGMTGWDWANQRSIFCAYDFDHITGHAPGVGVTDDKLQEIVQAATSIPWVQTRRSTRGGGLHLYVFLNEEDPIHTENHTVHAALARCILSKMSQASGFNFAAAIDACGGNMWVWHRDANLDNQGFALLSERTQELGLKDMPTNWRDHMDVVTRKRSKIKIRGIPDSEDAEFDEMASSRNIVDLDETHSEIIDGLVDCGCSTLWVAEYNLLQTHSCGFAKLMEDNPGKYKGFFETNSEGNNLSEPNCFAFPVPNGGFKVYRFSKGHSEHLSWNQDGQGYTSTYFNCRPDLELASLSMGGAEIDNGFVFSTLRHAAKAAQALGADMSDVESWLDEGRETQLQRIKATGRLKVKIEKRSSDRKPSTGWVEKQRTWEKIFKVDCEPRDIQNSEYPEFDNVFRALVSPSGEQAGWGCWDSGQSVWDTGPPSHVKMMLQKLEFTKTEAEKIMGGLLMKRWRLVHIPFQPEFPGNRQWNWKAPQYRFAPTILKGDSVPKHPHWDMILDHVFKELDETLPENPWALRHGIRTGNQYGQLWIASMLREPFEPLPYLFLHGPQNSGKSILHEAISKLITGGVCRADKALMSTGDHNGQLANAVLAVIEETNLSGRGGDRATNRMKDWVTSEMIEIRQMRTDAYLQRNTLHFLQCSNDRYHCLIMPGDTRITVLYVSSLDDNEEIPKTLLKKALEAEAPDFMRTLMDLEIPPAQGRLRIPVIVTSDKEHMESLATNSLIRFIEDGCIFRLGCKVLFKDFYKRFQDTLPDDEKGYWTQRRVSQSLPRKNPSGRSGGEGQSHIANLTFDESDVSDGVELFLRNGRLKKVTS